MSEIIHEKTKGNPYFVRQFLENLFNEQLLMFDFHKYEWKWNIEQIRRLGITENVIDLLIKRFEHLPPQALYLIKILAFAKTRIQIDLIPSLVSMGEAEAQEYIDLLSVSGIIYTEREEERITISFIDERLRNAAQVLCRAEEKQQINLLLARCYEHVESTTENDLFLLAGYYTEAIPLLTFEAEVEKVAGITKKAALLAKEKVAYALAEQFISTAISLVKPTVWKERYEWVLQIYNTGIEVSYMLGNYPRMEELALEVEKNALDVLDLDKVYEFRIQSHKALSNLDKSIQYGITYLKMLGISIKENPGQIQVIYEFIKTQNILKKKTEEELLNAPFITDRKLKTTFQIYSVMSPVAYFTSSNLLAVLASKQMQIIAKYGNLPLSPYIIASLGYTYCGIIGDIEKGYYYGNLALKLLEKYNLTENYARTHFAYNFFVRHWKEPIKNTIQPLQKAYETGLKSGDFEHAAYSLFMSFYHSFFAGTNLKELFIQGESNLLAIAGLSHRSSYFLMANMLQTVFNLSQKNSQPYLLEGKFYQAADNFPVHVQSNDKPNLVTWICTQLILGYTFNHPERVFATYEQGEKFIDAGLGALGRSYILFYISLSYYEYGHTLDAPLRKKYKKLAQKNRKILENWSKTTYPTYAHKYFLVMAEEYKSKNKTAKAREYFEKALESANDSGLIPMQALCWERSARFYLSIDQTNLATHHLLQSMRLYESWGALNKKEILEKEFSSLLRKPFIPISNDAQMPSHHTVNSMTDYTQLDMLSILKASQAISGNIRLEQLLENLMRIVLENAGAENGYLLLQERNKWVVRVKGHVNTGFGKPEEDMYLEDFKGAQAPFSTTIIHYVIRTRENVVLDYASQVGKFVSDPYISENRTKSLICIPLVNQGLVIAILYLENNLSTGAFTRERLEMLNMLTSQAAISIENAMLYEYLEEKVEERTEEVNRQKKELVEQSEQLKLTNLIIEKKNQDITASINYGSRIQSAMMPSINLLSHYLPETFIMFRPRDIVSGDFYWFTSHEGKIIVAAVDCTGHGVPGAFMSMIGIDLLNSIVNQKGITSPEDILNQLTLGVSNALQKEDNSLRDGMDMAICTISTENGKKVVSYAGAKNPLVYVKNGEMTYIKADRVAIGDGSHQYTRHDIVVDAPTMFYLYSDGYQDQFGGPLNRKFMSNRFKELLNQVSSLPSDEQKKVLETTLDEWITDTNQLDDILVMGFRLS
ncbi:SpoIIE family protein phosphatase [Cytophagales bacterium LB-30]|uniref:SpoIIE family protein phosphatase n=1 Tax=Shiella aurantiaca TaxID=3058365 RepID=A0ABT8F1F4_9BACT|nr:SpoIIE family protein phosphatase [Shiella aurantiaca]MDN4164129.1 SpoIIE family protein phosphatase [Shiella aurantiaca]